MDTYLLSCNGLCMRYAEPLAGRSWAEQERYLPSSVGRGEDEVHALCRHFAGTIPTRLREAPRRAGCRGRGILHALLERCQSWAGTAL